MSSVTEASLDVALQWCGAGEVTVPVVTVEAPVKCSIFLCISTCVQAWMLSDLFSQKKIF